MIRLARQVRFAINTGVAFTSPDAARATNGFAGYPSLNGLGYFFALDVVVAGELLPLTSYLLNIKRIDAVVRDRVVPMVRDAIAKNRFGGGAILLREIFAVLREAWRSDNPSATLESVNLRLSPFLSLCAKASELPMIRLSQKFEFSASHRLHNPALDEQANRDAFGKCNNPNGHGHNYELQVTLAGSPDETTGVLFDVATLERVVEETVIQRFDHKNLNVELPEFRDVNPSVEQIAKTIYRLLKPKFVQAPAAPAQLVGVTVWETPKTWCEYAE